MAHINLDLTLSRIKPQDPGAYMDSVTSLGDGFFGFTYGPRGDMFGPGWLRDDDKLFISDPATFRNITTGEHFTGETNVEDVIDFIKRSAG